MLNHAFVTTAVKRTITRNEYGDYVRTGGSDTTYKCRLREITQEVRNQQMQLVQTDAMAWFPPSTPVEEGDLWEIGDQTFTVISVNKAKRLGSTAIEFIKAGLQRSAAAIS